MNRQEFYKEKYRQLKPDWRDSLAIYVSIIDGLVSADTRVLDVGCGHVDFMKSVYEKSEFIYGLDTSKKTFERNKVIKNR